VQDAYAVAEGVGLGASYARGIGGANLVDAHIRRHVIDLVGRTGKCEFQLVDVAKAAEINPFPCGEEFRGLSLRFLGRRGG